ncbi:hypothetical protein C3B51_02365 [Pseudoalteromonas rubra]|uniref:Sce7725 family protein n=1 Tax=Pseudoalteromonas rubra TaxID=43658 RepID=A0A4Q7EMP1_9GAMM|nr:sce7725 family protein [Pseudoalteromonas rubra]RZM84681.1 hypothetical protein C3B51_02365 [Pseudoalteromonas rubra]
MYFPYLRGKQFELIALRELSEFISTDYLRPIIEPVKLNLSPLIRTVKHLNEKGFSPLIIMNPTVGELSSDSQLLLEELEDEELEYLPCVVLRGGESVSARESLGRLQQPFAIRITEGIDQEGIALAQGAELVVVDYDLPPNAINKLKNVVLLGDFFRKQKRNADYLKESSFSHLHSTYSSQKNVVGFGDYTMIGSEYSESGGPAYVVTIHASYINEGMFDEMFIRHYSSTDDGTPTDPAGKFAEALAKFIIEADEEPSIYYQSAAIDEFRKLYRSGHFPGLGLVKKLSMEHHIETVCNYLQGR